MKLLDKKFFEDLSPNVVNMYRKHTFEDAKDADGKKFKKYSTWGSKWVTITVKKKFKKSAPKKGYSYAQAKKGNMFPRQSSQFKDSTAPVLTGDLFRDFKEHKVTNSGFSFGTVKEGGKVRVLAKKGRNLASQKTVIPKKIAKFIVEEADEYIMNKMGKNFKNRTI